MESDFKESLQRMHAQIAHSLENCEASIAEIDAFASHWRDARAKTVACLTMLTTFAECVREVLVALDGSLGADE